MENNKPKIAIIGLKGLPAYGGAARVGENIIEQLKDKYDFTVLSVSSHSQKLDKRINGVNQIVFNKVGNGGLNTLFYYLKCLFHVLPRKYDLIHLHHAESGFITPFLRLKYKVVVTFHGIYKNNDPKFSKFLNWFFRYGEKKNVQYANQVVSVSSPDSEYIEKNYSKQILYIPNGINLKNSIEYRPVIQSQKKDYIFFAAGRIYQIKGLHLLLKAVKKINAQIEIKIAGDLNQIPEYRKEIEFLSAELNVSYEGMIKDKLTLMSMIAAAKFFVFPSLTEAMSMMLLEVVSMKTPVIASNILSNRAVFNDDELLFFKTNEADDLALKIEFALNNNDDMSQRAGRAYEKLKNEYTWKMIAKQYETIYDNLLK